MEVSNGGLCVAGKAVWYVCNCGETETSVSETRARMCHLHCSAISIAIDSRGSVERPCLVAPWSTVDICSAQCKPRPRMTGTVVRS